MSDGTRAIVRICEQLSEAQRLQVEDYARSLLPRELAATRLTFDEWLEAAQGVVADGVTTDDIMAMTRGEPTHFRDIKPLSVGGMPASEMLIRDRR